MVCNDKILGLNKELKDNVLSLKTQHMYCLPCVVNLRRNNTARKKTIAKVIPPALATPTMSGKFSLDSGSKMRVY